MAANIARPRTPTATASSPIAAADTNNLPSTPTNGSGNGDTDTPVSYASTLAVVAVDAGRAAMVATVDYSVGMFDRLVGRAKVWQRWAGDWFYRPEVKAVAATKKEAELFGNYLAFLEKLATVEEGTAQDAPILPLGAAAKISAVSVKKAPIDLPADEVPESSWNAREVTMFDEYFSELSGEEKKDLERMVGRLKIDEETRKMIQKERETKDELKAVLDQREAIKRQREAEEQKLGVIPAPPPFEDGEAPPPAPPFDIPDAPGMDMPSATTETKANLTSVKKDHKPGVKLKPLHWAKISAAQMRGTIWNDIYGEDIPLDTSEIEREFQWGVPKVDRKDDKSAAKQAADSKLEMDPSWKPAKAKVSLLDANRVYMVEIGLAQSKLSHDQVRGAIWKLKCEDGSAPTRRMWEQIMALLPTDDELKKVSGYAGPVTDLGSTEQLFKLLSSIPRVIRRVHCLAFREEADSLVKETEERLLLVRNAANQLRSCTRFRKLLLLVLSLGNYVNGGTTHGRALGFRLEFLNKLQTTKSATQGTMLEYVVRKFYDREPEDAAALAASLASVPRASQVESGSCTEDMKKLREGIEKLKQELLQVNLVDPFKAPMTEFQSSITQRMLRLSESYHQTLQTCDQTAHYFGEDTGLVWEHMFRIFTTFLTSYQEASKTIEAERVAKETKARHDVVKGALGSRLAEIRTNQVHDEVDEAEFND